LRSILFAAIFMAFTASAHAEETVTPMSPQATAEAIDELFAEAWKKASVQPAPQADDSEFVRRLYLDLAGRIPAASETREFLEDTSPSKRAELVERLLDGPAFVRHFTIIWRNALIPQAFNEPFTRQLVPGFEAWLWKHFSEDTPYDQIVHELITTPIDFGNDPQAVLTSASSPSAFFIVRQLQPENLATGTSRAFLGVRLDCAQCHDHPFDKWKQNQFWSMAAFYSGFKAPDGADPENPAMMMNTRERLDSRSIQVPSTGEAVPAIFLTGSPTGSRQRTIRGLRGWLRIGCGHSFWGRELFSPSMISLTITRHHIPKFWSCWQNNLSLTTSI
jgi:hypothetical protein